MPFPHLEVVSTNMFTTCAPYFGFVLVHAAFLYCEGLWLVFERRIDGLPSRSYFLRLAGCFRWVCCVYVYIANVFFFELTEPFSYFTEVCLLFLLWCQYCIGFMLLSKELELFCLSLNWILILFFRYFIVLYHWYNGDFFCQSCFSQYN